MSHAGSWRAACSNTIHFPWFHFETLSVARGVTDPSVGSGALLGRLGGCRNRVEERTWLIDWKRVRLSQKPRRVRRHERSRIVMMGEEMSQANRCGYLVRSARRATQWCRQHGSPYL
jgi:hypothetical protein